MTLRGVAHAGRGSFVAGGEPLVFHCHHYNLALQRLIEDSLGFEEATQLFVRAAEEVAYPFVSRHLEGVLGHDARLALATTLHAELGFGKLAGRGDEAAGEATGERLHYATGWRSKLSPRREPVCAFHAGYLAASMAAAAGLPRGTFEVHETSCVARGDDACRFRLARRAAPLELPTSVGEGELPSSAAGEAPALTGTGNVRAAEVLDALGKLPLVGNEEGLIPAFGVYLTRHFANYYARISYELEGAIEGFAAELGESVRVGLVHAGHICAFHTFGGIACSPEWEGLIEPMCRDRADWFHGMTTVANALGWGAWRTRELVPGERCVVDVYASYESNAYLAMRTARDRPRCYLHTGGIAGLMNLLWVGDITKRPTLDAAYYESIYASPESFVGDEVRCRAKGDPCCTIVADRRRF